MKTSTAPNGQQQAGLVRTFLADESGAVMTEFVIVLPVLMYLLLSNLLITDVNRFSLSRFGLTMVGTWRAVAQETPGGGMARTDQISSGTMPFQTNPSMWPQYPKFFDQTIPSMHPFEILGIDSTTYYQADFTPSRLGLSGSAMTYRNQYYINPVNAAIGSRVGNAPSSQDAQLADTQIGTVTQYSKLPILFDTYSPSWGPDGLQRPRNVDRFTQLGNDRDFLAFATGTLLAGNRDVVDQISALEGDAGVLPIASATLPILDGVIYGLGAYVNARGCYGALLGSDPNVTAMWKVDKSVYNHNHDVNGTMPYDSPLTEKHRLEQISGAQAWEMVQ
jgi:hypothetical protein